MDLDFVLGGVNAHNDHSTGGFRSYWRAPGAICHDARTEKASFPVHHSLRRFHSAGAGGVAAVFAPTDFSKPGIYKLGIGIAVIEPSDSLTGFCVQFCLRSQSRSSCAESAEPWSGSYGTCRDDRKEQIPLRVHLP